MSVRQTVKVVEVLFSKGQGWFDERTQGLDPSPGLGRGHDPVTAVIRQLLQ